VIDTEDKLRPIDPGAVAETTGLRWTQGLGKVDLPVM
jgi:hypothetical protein